MSNYTKLIATFRASAATMPNDAAVAVQYRAAADAIEALQRENAELRAELERSKTMAGLIQEGLRTIKQVES